MRSAAMNYDTINTTSNVKRELELYPSFGGTYENLCQRAVAASQWGDAQASASTDVHHRFMPPERIWATAQHRRFRMIRPIVCDIELYFDA
ncbi:hypothetical protein Tcan_13646 [Toxocara canis]|uniref:Uncharacterized protein n=2 Tax=Toxocara canis TaxID=6265 RepID=A0A0B2VQC5_TOXCA|nr:hypothetical protein Tcan_13646 [Toxocara canis]VDM43654.1 unnamed protein product [Toxocara canis]